MIFNKNKGKLTLQDLFSNEILQQSLENLSWIHAENDKKQAWEFVKLRDIQAESQVLGMVLSSMQRRMKLGDYMYTRMGNRLEREGPSIKPKRKFHPDFKVSKVFTEILKPIPKIKGFTVVK